jgi:hypothetical protein
MTMENWEMQTAINTFVDELTKYLFPDVPWLNEGNQREYEGIQAKCEELLPKYFRAKPLNCTWKEDGDAWENYAIWDTDCGGRFELTEGTPEYHNMRYCCYCGKKIKEIKWMEK